MATKLIAAGLAFGLVLAGAGGTLAQSASPDEVGLRALCAYGFDAGTDIVIDSCTRLIASGALSPADLASAYEVRGLAYELSENFDEALADLTRRMDLLPPDPASFRERAKLQGSFDAAIADASEAIRLAPDDPVNHLARARLFHAHAFVSEDKGWGWNADGAWVMKGVWDEARVAAALSDYAETIRIAPYGGEAYGWRAQLFDAMGDRASAIPDYTTAMGLVVGGFGNRERRAQAYLKLGNFALAKADLDVLLRFYPRTSTFYAQRGEAYAGLGDHALAIEDFDEGLRLDHFLRGQRIAALISRARSYRALGQTAAAEADLEQARLLVATQPAGR